jgi:hypothetical protein
MESLPLWFLVLSLFLPRISLVIAYFEKDLVAYALHGWIPPALGVVIPRALVLILIYRNQGFSGWLLLHAIVMACVYGGSGSKVAGRG